MPLNARGMGEDKKRGDGVSHAVPSFFTQRLLSETGLLCGVPAQRAGTERTDRHAVVGKEEGAEVDTVDGGVTDRSRASVVAAHFAIGDANEARRAGRNRGRDDGGEVDVLERIV